MTTLPTTLAMIAASITVTTAFSVQNADLNNDGIVDGIDLVSVTSNLGQACDGDCPADLNNDGIINTSDIMELMQQWGEVEGFVAEQAQSTTTTTTDSSDSSTEDNKDLSWQGQDPVLLDAIYYDQYTEFFSHGGFNRWNTAKEYNQGEHVQSWAAENNIAVQPMVYGSVDWDHDNNLTEEDKANFAIWLDEYVPADYDGPLCLDLEGQWWGMLDTTNQAVMDTVINVYLEHLEVAKSLRPNAKIGFWGFPKKTHTNPNIQTASVDRLLSACTAIFPDVYEWNPGNNDSARLQLHVERAMEMVHGQTPVYAQTSPRYKTSSTSPRYLHDQAEFMRDQVHSSLNAVWTDAYGKEHRIQGIALWDAYTYVSQFTEGWSGMTLDERKALWNDLDLMHVDFLTEMKTLVDVASAEASARRSSVQQNSDAADAVAQAAAVEAAAQAAAAQAAAEAAAAERQRQKSRLVKQLNSTKVRFAQSSKSYRKSAASYSKNRKLWSQAKRAFSKAKSKYSKGSKGYKRALAQYKKARRNVQRASRSFRKNRTSYRAARVAMNNAKATWNQANATWSQTAQQEQTLLASK